MTQMQLTAAIPTVKEMHYALLILVVFICLLYHHSHSMKNEDRTTPTIVLSL